MGSFNHNLSLFSYKSRVCICLNRFHNLYDAIPIRKELQKELTQYRKMKKLILLLLFIPIHSFGQQQNYPYKWPMYNDINVNLKVENPSYEVNDGPLIMFDSEISK